nr:hypothetical protein [Tanacetum cinerariifolium]
MDSIISLGQKNTLAEYMTLSGADNRPPMLDKDLYDSWKSKMELYMQNREHERMIFESVENGPLIWPTVEENGERECKMYDAFDKFTNIKEESLHILPPEWSKFMTDVKLGKDLHTFNYDQLHAYLEQHELHANEVCLMREGHTARKCTQPKRQRNAAWYKEKAMLAEAKEARQLLDEEQIAFLADLRIPTGQGQTIISYNAAFQTENLDTYDSDCDDLSPAQAVLMANISNYGFDVISEIKPTLYDGVVISNKHVAIPMIDDEETLILEEESRLKILTEDFGKCFTPQQELSAEQAFWLRISNPTIESSTPPVRVEVPSELPKVSLVNESLKKLKFQLALFDSVVKKRTTPTALTKGEWRFEHTKTVFNNEIIPYLKSLKSIFNVFDKDLLNKITKVKIVFDQIEAAVQQSLVDKQCMEIANKELLLENDRLSQQIMPHDIVSTVMNCMSINVDCMNVDIQRCASCEKCSNLDVEFSKSKQTYEDLLKNYSQLEKHCILLELSIQINQEIFQKNESCCNQNAPEIPEYFEKNDLKAQLQDKDTTICMLKDTIKSLRKNNKKEIVDHDICDLPTSNAELENSVAKLLYENKSLCNETKSSEAGF